MSNYEQKARVKIVPEGETESTLVAHDALSIDGRPLCGQPVRPWRGRAMVLRNLGPGVVTCGNCYRIRIADAWLHGHRFADGAFRSVAEGS